MKKILLQAGHQNTTTGATGAPEEMANNIRIRDRLSQILISKGFQLTLGDANFASTNDFDLALAMHCDANYAGDEGGGFVSAPDASVDSVNKESLRIRDVLRATYFANSGIREVEARENPNTTFYYWWYNLSLKTPCCLIEMGESIDPHDKVILADTDRVANAIARGICKAFSVPYDQTTPTQPAQPANEDTVTIRMTEYTSLKAQISELTGKIKLVSEQIALAGAECQSKLDTQKKELIAKIIDLASKL